MILVSVTDFKTGQYTLAQSNDSAALIQSYIDREEKRCIYKILGPTLGDLIIAYIAGGKSPAVTRYDNIINAFYLQNTTDLHFAWVGRQDEFRNPAFFDSYGLKDVLMNNIYYYYVIETSMTHGQAGVVGVKVDTADGVGSSNVFRFVEQKWNKAGFDTWLAIRWRCLYYEPATYPEFTGIPPIVKYGSLF